VTVTSNWVQLTMRYVVERKKRRRARSFNRRVRASKDVTIASETMDFSVHPPEGRLTEWAIRGCVLFPGRCFPI
jgi:hypothetical protein